MVTAWEEQRSPAGNGLGVPTDPGASSVDAHPPPPLVPVPVPDRKQGHGCCGPSSAPSPRGRAGAAPGPELLRAQEEDGCPGCARIVDPAAPAGRGSLIVVSPHGGSPESTGWKGIPRGVRGALPAPAQSWRLSVRCDSSFPTCQYFSSSCVVPMIFFLNSCSPHMEEAGSLSLVQHRT